MFLGQGENFSARGIYRVCISVWTLLGLAWMAGFISEGQQTLASVVDRKEKNWALKTGETPEQVSSDDGNATKVGL